MLLGEVLWNIVMKQHKWFVRTPFDYLVEVLAHTVSLCSSTFGTNA